MSLSDTQQVFQLLTEIDKLLADIELKINNIEGRATHVESTIASFRQLERLALRWLVVARKLGLPDDMGKAINIMARVVIMIRMVQISATMMMATGPGWVITALIGVAGIVGTALSAGSALEGY